MNKKIVIGIIITTICMAGYFIFLNLPRRIDTNPQEKEILKQDNQSSSAPQTVNKQASFAIFTNGTFRVFTASMYHNLSEDAFIQADNPNIVHVKKSRITWDDFFKTLPFSLTNECLTTGTN